VLDVFREAVLDDPGSLPRDKTVCSKISMSEQQLLDLLAGICDASRSRLLRVSFTYFALALFRENNMDPPRYLSGGIDAEVRELMEKCIEGARRYIMRRRTP